MVKVGLIVEVPEEVAADSREAEEVLTDMRIRDHLRCTQKTSF